MQFNVIEASGEEKDAFANVALVAELNQIQLALIGGGNADISLN